MRARAACLAASAEPHLVGELVEGPRLADSLLLRRAADLWPPLKRLASHSNQFLRPRRGPRAVSSASLHSCSRVNRYLRPLADGVLREVLHALAGELAA